ncbi:uncharacterized protein LOC125667384 [Ostrea edulis]|uniref:uncharacterized protein LOC125667384 n=1 Tax=Ostrea edulis TaxID=37623 RepID=UPI0024AFF3E4|nr:uncharacterized protein LOC125667384 [Ostrea edulis]XP_056002848.1 uncharacterized protein LOC125667384 [Ostrea edulis]
MASKHLVPEQQNFVRLSLACVDKIRVMLGYILQCQIPPEDLFKTIQANTTLLTGNQKLSPEQLKLCYKPCPFVPDYKCFDITLLYKLIRNLCQTLQPSQGWGQKPRNTDIKIGDDIERLRLFRNEMVGHAESSSVPDGIFASKWSELESTFKRIQGFLSSNGITKNFVEQLVSLKRTDFGWQDHEKIEMRLMFERIKLTDTPKLTVQGDEQKIWGERACFMARYEDGDSSNNWPITWQKITGNTIEQLDISTERYRGSSSQQLVISRVNKYDQGEYRATVLREEKETHILIPSNTIYLTVTGDLPILEIENAVAEGDRVTIHYCVFVNDQSPAVYNIVWTKNGKPLETNAAKYSDGRLMDAYLTIHSPTLTDIGQYSCAVSNAVGSVTKSIDLHLPSVSIVDDLQVAVGNPITIEVTIQSCPTPVSAIWQKRIRLDLKDFENIDINQSKYFGSKDDPENPILVIPKTTLEDGIFYRLVVSNGIGQSTSNTTYLKLIGDVPSLFVPHVTSTSERSVTLACQMTTSSNSPEVSDVFWTKDDRKIDIVRSGGKYSGGSITDPSLTIKAVNSNDGGRYQCCASNSVGNMWSETILLESPTSLLSIPVALNAEWKVKHGWNGDFQAIDMYDPLYRGCTIAFPRPRLVQNGYRAEQLETFQLEVFNLIGSSRRNTQDKVVESSDANMNQEISKSLKKLYSNCSYALFANLSDDLAESLPENKLQRLKDLLTGVNGVDAESIKKVTAVRGFVMLLQEKQLFTMTDVLFMQLLLRKVGCKELYEKCIQYARKQRALCLFEKDPDNGFKHVQFHIAGTLQIYSNEELHNIRNIVIAFLGCKDDDVVLDGIHLANSFFVVLGIREIFVNKLLDMDQQHIQQLCDLKVDYFILDHEKHNMNILQKDSTSKENTIWGRLLAPLGWFASKLSIFRRGEPDVNNFEPDVMEGSYPTKTKEEQWREKNKSSKSNADMIGVPERLVSPEERTITSPEIEKSLGLQPLRYQSDVRRTYCYRDFDDDIFTSVIRKDSSRISSHGSYPTKIEEEKWREKKKSSKSNADLIGWKHPEHLISPKGISLSQKVGFSVSQISSITVSDVGKVRHISVVTSDRLWVSDYVGHLLQVDSSGRVLHDKQRFECSSFPFRYNSRGSHTVTEDGDLLFIYCDKVRKLTSDGTLTTLLTTDWGAYCIHSSRINGDILVGSIGKVTRYDRTGRRLQVIKEGDKGQTLYELPIYITENKNGDIWISDMDKRAVVVVDKSGRHRFDYTGRQSEDSSYMYHSFYTGLQLHFSPRGICTDVLGHVLVCDVYNDSVHLLDQDGQFLSLLLTGEQHGIDHPAALCVDDQHNLYLGQRDSNTINVYKYLKDTDFK